MRSVLLLLAIAGLAFSQAMTEAAGVIAGGSVGGVAGKKVGQGITNVFQKHDTCRVLPSLMSLSHPKQFSYAT